MQGKIKEFRLLDENHETVALELGDQVYSAVSNQRGDIVQLIGSDLTDYRYDAFGNFVIKGKVVSPWLFFGQRYCSENNLYHYCRRDYDPCLGTWLTPDPIGFADGPNLYAYVHNNPLTYVDPYGLFWAEAREACHGMTRGFADDTSWGATEYALGEYHGESMYGNAGFFAGTAVSVVTGMAYGGTEAKICKAAGQFGKNVISKSAQAVRSFRYSRQFAKCAKNPCVKQALENSIKSTKTVSIAKLGEHCSGDPTKPFQYVKPVELRNYLKNVGNYKRDKIMADATKMGFELKGISPKGHVLFIDKKTKLPRLKIHPKDNDTIYEHIHIYTKNGKSLDMNLRVVSYRSPAAHIEYGGVQ